MNDTGKVVEVINGDIAVVRMEWNAPNPPCERCRTEAQDIYFEARNLCNAQLQDTVRVSFEKTNNIKKNMIRISLCLVIFLIVQICGDLILSSAGIPGDTQLYAIVGAGVLAYSVYSFMGRKPRRKRESQEVDILSLPVIQAIVR